MFSQLNIKQNVTFLTLVNIFTLNETLQNVFNHGKLDKNFDIEFWMTHKYKVVVKKKLITKQAVNVMWLKDKIDFLARIFIIGVF